MFLKRQTMLFFHELASCDWYYVFYHRTPNPSLALVLKEMLHLLYYLIWYLIIVIKYNGKHWKREPLVEKKKTV
jgi:hypothetical protein